MPEGQQRAYASRGPKSGRADRGEGIVDPLLPRLMPKVTVNPQTGCWVWNGYRNDDGYGQIDWGGLRWLTHRATYTDQRGPIPDGMTLDHTCRNRACCNPWHLEVAEQRVNLYRGDSFVGLNARKTHCPQGHPYDEENTVVRYQPHKNAMARFCRACSVERGRRDYHRKVRAVCVGCGWQGKRVREVVSDNPCPKCGGMVEGIERKRRAA